MPKVVVYFPNFENRYFEAERQCVENGEKLIIFWREKMRFIVSDAFEELSGLFSEKARLSAIVQSFKQQKSVIQKQIDPLQAILLTEQIQMDLLSHLSLSKVNKMFKRASLCYYTSFYSKQVTELECKREVQDQQISAFEFSLTLLNSTIDKKFPKTNNRKFEDEGLWKWGFEVLKCEENTIQAKFIYPRRYANSESLKPYQDTSESLVEESVVIQRSSVPSAVQNGTYQIV